MEGGVNVVNNAMCRSGGRRDVKMVSGQIPHCIIMIG